MLFSVFYVGDSCQGWGREFESRFPLQIQKSPHRKMGAFLCISEPYSNQYTNSDNQKMLN